MTTCRGRLRGKRDAPETPAENDKKPKKEESASPSNPLDVLIKAAMSMNPKQFELPRDMSVSMPFPGTDKGKSEHAVLLVQDPRAPRPYLFPDGQNMYN